MEHRKIVNTFGSMEKKKKNKGGRPRLIESPQHMWELFQEYQKWTEENPIKVHDFVGKDAKEIYRTKQRPLTLVGFYAYVYTHEIEVNAEHYFTNQGGAYEEFLGICAKIRQTIQHDQVSGGMAGIYNASLTARLNGLTDKQEQTIITEQPLFGGDKGKDKK